MSPAATASIVITHRVVVCAKFKQLSPHPDPAGLTNSFGKFTQHSGSLLHDLSGNFHLRLQVKAVWHDSQTTRFLTDQNHVTSVQLQPRKDLLRKDDSDGIADLDELG